MKLTPEDIQVLVTKAFCLEAIADKKDCTTRYVDLENRPLESFVIAGINVGPVFETFAADRLAGGTAVFDRFSEALDTSNKHKSAKYVNFGLLEIMFPAVAARLQCHDPSKVVATMLEVMRRGSRDDVRAMVAARKKAWETSGKRAHKLSQIKEPGKAASPMGFYDTMTKTGIPNSSAVQWATHYMNGLPWVAAQLDYMQAHTDEPLLDRIKNAFDPLREEYPGIKIGILADMSAAALFLHLSFQ